PHRIKGLAFLESYLRPAANIDMVSLPLLEMASVLNTPDGGYDVIMHSNYFINKVMPSGILRTLTEAEMTQYQLPFQTPGTCKPLWQFLQELPLGEEDPSPILDLIRQYSTALTRSPVPKLMFYAVPGFLTTIETVQWAKSNLPNLTLVEIGDALHYPQESDPKTVGTELAKWYQQIKA
ncbi:MAG: haloalkane dehalogenase, partial [Gammaproteobacteria bacterium]|nr:haloalkane dehalogenase [Gammaproteobacteria bacterium]